MQTKEGRPPKNEEVTYHVSKIWYIRLEAVLKVPHRIFDIASMLGRQLCPTCNGG